MYGVYIILVFIDEVEIKMTTLPPSITQRHNGIVAALEILKKLPEDFITNTSEKSPTVIADVTTLNELEKYLNTLNIEKYLNTLNKKNTKKLVELQHMVEHPSDTPLGAYLKACKAYIDKFTNQDTLYALDTGDAYSGMNGFNISVTAFYEKYKEKLTIISTDDIELYALARFEIIAKRIFMLLYYREHQSDFNGGKSRSSKKRPTRRRPRRKSTKRLRRASRTSRK